MLSFRKIMGKVIIRHCSCSNLLILAHSTRFALRIARVRGGLSTPSVIGVSVVLISLCDRCLCLLAHALRANFQ